MRVYLVPDDQGNFVEADKPLAGVANYRTYKGLAQDATAIQDDEKLKGVEVTERGIVFYFEQK